MRAEKARRRSKKWGEIRSRHPHVDIPSQGWTLNSMGQSYEWLRPYLMRIEASFSTPSNSTIRTTCLLLARKKLGGLASYHTLDAVACEYAHAMVVQQMLIELDGRAD